LADWLNAQCALEVRLARGGESIFSQLGIFVAPDDVHIEVRSNGTIKLVDTPQVSGHKPSGDVLFHSCAENFGSRAMGIILTGMGCDGAKGITAMHNQGAFTLAQNKESSVIYGMPRVAVEMGGIDKVLPIEGIHYEMMKCYKQLTSTNPSKRIQS
jgi:two-component system chemotaxis response regulator CheB